MNRRKFILLSAAGATAVSFSVGYYYYSGNTPSCIDPTEPCSLLQIMDEATISHIGKKYLETIPAENDRKILNQLLRNSASTENHVAEFIRNTVSNDFTKNRLTILDGWILSQTEARQCALYALKHNQ